jgi:Transposase DDE domain group 1
MGEAKSKLKEVVVAVKQVLENPVNDDISMSVQTPGGRIQVRWDARENATAMGQLAFFAEFLEVSGLFDRWVEQCPLHYSSPNAPTVRDVLGTWLLSILDGHRRYAHVASLRGDAVAPQILGMNSIMGDESLRRGLAQIAPAPKEKHSDEERLRQQAQVNQAEKWMELALQDSVQHALNTPWILDIDTTIKTLFGRQSGAEVSYNPHKPGRPSHAIHTYWIANLRLVLQAQVQSGKSHSSAHTLPGLIELISRLPKEQRPQLVRGDCGFGNENVMCELETIEQAYLFKLKQSSNVKRLIERQWRQRAWRDAGQGWEACEDTLKLTGWTQARRVIVMRHAVKGNLVAEVQKPERKSGKSAKSKKQEPQQTSLCFIDENAPAKLWEYAVLVTNTTYEVQHMGQLYRDRADCENGFDELKNQWGWGGYSTQDIERCNLSAQAVALIYNWWSWYVRLAHPKARMEAITSRPLLLAAIGRITQHGGQTRVLLSVTHAAATQVKALVANVRAGLQHIRATAPQLPSVQRWKALVLYIVEKIIAASTENPIKTAAPPALAMG